MKALSIARPYARALFEVAQEKQLIAEFANHLEYAGKLFSTAEMQTFLHDPRVTKSQTKNVVMDVLKPVLSNEYFQHFVDCLIDNERLDVLPEIAELYSVYKAEQERETTVKFVTAMPVSDGLIHRLQEKLTQKLNLKVKVETVIDPELLGGAMIYMDNNKVIDGSLRTQLQELASQWVA